MTSIEGQLATALTMKPAGSGPLGIGLPWAKAPCGAPLRDGLGTCRNCGHPRDAHIGLESHALYQACRECPHVGSAHPYQPKPVHEDSALDADHEAIEGSTG